MEPGLELLWVAPASEMDFRTSRFNRRFVMLAPLSVRRLYILIGTAQSDVFL